MVSVIVFFILINLHLFFFIFLYFRQVAFTHHSLVKAYVSLPFFTLQLISGIGFYLLCRCITSYSLCLMWSPRSPKDLKKNRINYEKKRENGLKNIPFALISSESKTTIKQFQFELGPIEHELKLSNTVCKECFYIKPQRTEHCRVCRSCYLRYDNHYFWMNTCIGLDNYRFFIQFIFHVLLTSGFSLLILNDCKDMDFVKQNQEYAMYFQIFHIGILCLFGIFFGCQLWLIKQDLTTYEFIKLLNMEHVQRMKPLGFCANLYLLFGSTKYCLFLTSQYNKGFNLSITESNTNEWAGV